MVTISCITLKQFVEYLQGLQKETGSPNFSKSAIRNAISARDPKARKLALEYVVDKINEAGGE